MSAFASETVSFGIVVHDIQKSLAFYTQALGLTEVSQFDVPAEMGGESGLSDHKPFHVHVLKLGDSEEGTAVKLMQFPDAPGSRPDNRFIHSTYGIRYLTVHVNDMKEALERAAEHGATPIAQGPCRLPDEFGSGIDLAVVRDPDGNMIELIGPAA